MPKENPKPKKKTARPLNRWRIGSLSVIQTGLLALILLAANYLSLHHYHRVDASRDKDYSLASLTRNYLASPEVKDREQPIRWIMAYRRTSPFYERVRALSEEYARLSNGRIQLTLVDPLRDPDRMQEVIATYGITLIRDLIIIDARTDQQPVSTENKERVKILHPNIKIVPSEQLLTFGTVNNQRKVTGFQGEDMLTSRLIESIEGKPKTMALIADKSRLGSRDSSESRKVFEDLLRFQNIDLTELQIAGLQAIPKEVEGLVIFAPNYDFTESEIQMLDEYWNRPRSSLLVLIDENGAPPQLKAFLRGYGVTVQNDRILSKDRKGVITSARTVFSEGIPFTRELARQSTEFGGASTSLDVREGAEDLLVRQIHPMGVLEVAADFWGETKFKEGNTDFDEREDHGPPLSLAACVTRGAQADDRFAAETSRMIVIGNSDFIDPAHHRAENLDLLSSAANWLVGRDSLSGVRSRELRTYKLPLLQAQMSFINRCNLFFIPVAFLLLGAFIWSSRRA